MLPMFRRICYWEQGQEIAEYAVMLAVILVIIIGTVKLIGAKQNGTPQGVHTSLPR